MAMYTVCITAVCQPDQRGRFLVGLEKLAEYTRIHERDWVDSYYILITGNDLHRVYVIQRCYTKETFKLHQATEVKQNFVRTYQTDEFLQSFSFTVLEEYQSNNSFICRGTHTRTHRDMYIERDMDTNGDHEQHSQSESYNDIDADGHADDHIDEERKILPNSVSTGDIDTFS